MRDGSLEVFRQFEEQLRAGRFASAYTLCGEERFLVEQATRELVEYLVPPEARDWDLERISAAEADAQDIVSSAMTWPMVAERRLLVVTDLDKTKPSGLAVWHQYLQRPSASTVVVFPLPGIRLAARGLSREEAEQEGPGEKKKEAEARAKRGLSLPVVLQRYTRVVEFAAVSESEAVYWVTERAARIRKKILPEAAQLLVAQVGPDLQALENEMEKLALRVGEEELITAEHVEDVVVGQRGFTVFHLRDAVAEQDLTRSLTILRRLLELGVPEGLILNALVDLFVQGCQVSGLARRGATDAQIAAEVDPKYKREWMVRRLRRFASLYDKPAGRWERALEALGKADLALKLSYQTKRRILELLVYCLVKDRPSEVLEVPEEVE
ncbi:MAG: DNA polymerase III subunit delta [candidate division KSB1 bacterium]|nr:DNA polymerase III subunit delta [candidate division KSB1 bacterium]